MAARSDENSRGLTSVCTLEIAAHPDEHGDSGAVDVDHVRQVKQHDKRPACDDAVDVPMQGNGVWELEPPADANDR